MARPASSSAAIERGAKRRTKTEPKIFEFTTADCADKNGICETSYLSEEYFALYGAAVKKAKSLEMFLTIYDEYGFPSGSGDANMGDGIPRFKNKYPEATLQFDAIAHDVSNFEIMPAEHNKKTGLPQGYERGKTPNQPNHMVDWVNCIRNRGTPKGSTDEAFIETATFLMSLVSQQQRRMVRWDATKEEIV